MRDAIWRGRCSCVVGWMVDDTGPAPRHSLAAFVEPGPRSEPHPPLRRLPEFRRFPDVR